MIHIVERIGDFRIDENFAQSEGRTLGDKRLTLKDVNSEGTREERVKNQVRVVRINHPLLEKDR